MSNEELKKHLESIKDVACESYNNLQDALDALQAIKTSAQAAIPLATGQVKEILEGIEDVACQQYTTLAGAQMAISAIKTSVELAIKLLGK